MTGRLADLFNQNDLRGPDGFAPQSDSPQLAFHLAVNQFLENIEPYRGHWHLLDTEEFKRFQEELLNYPPDEQAALMPALFFRLVHNAAEQNWHYVRPLSELGQTLLRRKLPLTEPQLIEILEQLPVNAVYTSWWFSFPLVLKHVERLRKEGDLSPKLEKRLRRLRPSLQRDSARDPKLLRRIAKVLGEDLYEHIETTELWAYDLMQQIQAMPDKQRDGWHELIEFALGASSNTPTERWLAQAGKHLEQVGESQFLSLILGCFPQVPAKAEARIPANASLLLKGLAWMCILFEDRALPQVIGDLAVACFYKIPSVGARAQKVGNACIYVLGALPDKRAVTELVRLRQRVKYRQAQALIQKALAGAAMRQGISVFELEELAVSDHGLDMDGSYRVTLGDFTAELRIVNAASVSLQWLKPDGSPQKALPAVVRQEHKETLASLRSMVKTIEKDLRAQRDRIERFMSREHHWDYPDWKQRYIEHPLIAQLACRLIWHFQTGEESRLGIWQDGEFIDAEGKPLQHLDGSTKVRLWHPIGFPLEQIRAWRVWLENNAVVQPFKQAHREVYILTDAELETNTYSNRFAAHILKQHQFAALCRQRGWDYSLHGSFDGGTWAKKSLPEWDVQAEFTVEGIQQETLMSAAWICLYISTDQVRFLRDGNPLPLSEVPAIAFAELMRDVDLFVGVASVGNDPDWQDRGEMPGFDRYWHSYSFGDLSATAQTRREVLERLLPRLKIRDQAYIEGRFLVVKGQLRIYKIHLGSSNILMEPNDQYLCIIPDRSSANPAQYPVFLPFDGDQTLAVILSKAFMLAEDTKIKDTSITSQIKQ